jgi:branched-chain amino acid transport system substrate-binding protein
MAAVVIVGCTVLAACGSSSSGGSNAKGATGSIPVGALMPLTGRIADLGHTFLSGVQLGVTDVNDHGGVLGRKLKLSVGDDGGDAVDAVPAFRSIQLHHPVAMFGPTSLTFSTVQKEFDADHIVDFGILGSTSFYQLPYKYVYHAIVSDPSIGGSMAYYAIQQGYKRAVAIFGADSSSQTLKAQVLNPYKAHGGTVVSDISIVPGQASYRSELTKALASHPDFAFIQTDPQTSKTLFADARELGAANMPYIGSDQFIGADEAQAVGCAIASKNLTGVNSSVPTGPAVQYFNALYQKVHHAAAPPNVSDMYDSVVVAALAMTAAKSTDPQVWNNFVRQVSDPAGVQVNTYAEGVAALKQGKKIDYVGAYTTWQFNKFGDIFVGQSITKFKPDCKTIVPVANIDSTALAKFLNTK